MMYALPWQKRSSPETLGFSCPQPGSACNREAIDDSREIEFGIQKKFTTLLESA